MTNNKADYEPIPDVETAAGGSSGTSLLSPKDMYPGLSDDCQIELMSTLDDAIANSSQLHFQLPSVDPNDVASQGEAFIKGLLAPTITAVCTTIAAILLSATNKASTGAASVSSLLIQIFPYANAVIIFSSSFRPIQRRFMAAIEPVFVRMDGMQELAIKKVRDIATTVAETLGSLEQKVHETIEPIRPTLEKATQCEAALQRIRPGIDIPDPTDIDREFDEARGIVGDKVDEAAKHIDMDNYLPKPLQSADAFYWRIVFPVACAALLIQLGLAFATTYHGSSAVGQGYNNVSDATHFGAASFRGTNMTQYQNQVKGFASQVDAKVHSTLDEFNATAAALSVSLDDKKSDGIHVSGFDVPDITSKTVSLELNESSSKNVGGVKTTDYNDALEDRVPGLKDTPLKAVEGLNATEGVEVQLRDRVQQYKGDLGEYEAEFDTAVGNARSMLKSVVFSYLMAFLQLALVYLITNKAIKAWLVNKALEQASDGVARKLREHGVGGSLEDVFGARMVRVRSKLLKIFTLSKELEELLGKLGLVTGNPAALTSGANALAGRLGFGNDKKN